MKDQQKNRTVELAKGFLVVMDEKGIPRSYVDGRPYRYGVNPTNASSSGYPFSVLGKDVILRTVHEMIEKEQVLTEERRVLLNRKIRSTNMNYVLLETILTVRDTLSPEQRQESERGIGKFEELMNSPL